MTNRQFAAIAFAIIGLMFVMLLVDTHPRSTEPGYKDCPRIGSHLRPDQKRR